MEYHAGDAQTQTVNYVRFAVANPIQAYIGPGDVFPLVTRDFREHNFATVYAVGLLIIVFVYVLLLLYILRFESYIAPQTLKVSGASFFPQKNHLVRASW